MTTPINQASELNRRSMEAQCDWETMFERLNQAAHNEAPAAPAPDPEYHAGTGHGAPVAWLVIALIAAVMACALAGLLFNEWQALGGQFH
jgi:hypothetical protein